MYDVYTTFFIGAAFFTTYVPLIRTHSTYIGVGVGVTFLGEGSDLGWRGCCTLLLLAIYGIKKEIK